MANILYVTNSGSYGGMERYVLELTSGMVKRGHKVFVWCKDGPMALEYEKAGGFVLRKRIGFDIDPLYIWDLAGFIKRNKVEILHANELKAVVNALLACLISNVKLKITHSHTPISTWKITQVKKYFNVSLYSFLVNKLSDFEIALTESIKKIKISEGIKEKKLIVIPNGIDIDRFDIDPKLKMGFLKEIRGRYRIPLEYFVLGNLSRLTEEKGYDTLLRAFSLIMSDKTLDKEFFLLIAGGGKMENHLKKMAEELGILDRFVITGVFKEEDKVKFYASMDLLTFPSLTEGFGYVIAEAMVSSLPIVASDLPALRDVALDTITYFTAGEENDLYIKIKKMIYHWDKAHLKTVDAKKRARDLFSVEKFMESYSNLYLKERL